MRGIPTTVDGRLYRSRLEARWAEFFKLCGWQFEYEPFDLDGWIPDFLIRGETSILVEVKPVTKFPLEIATKIEVASRGVFDGHYLILGCSIPVESMTGNGGEDKNIIGWLDECGEYGCGWGDALFGRATDGDDLGIGHDSGSFRNVLTGGYDGNWLSDSTFGGPAAVSLWAKAGNHVQWKAPRVQAPLTDAEAFALIGSRKHKWENAKASMIAECRRMVADPKCVGQELAHAMATLRDHDERIWKRGRDA